MRGASRRWAAVGLGVLMLVIAALLLMKDVYADEAAQYTGAEPADGRDSCGSAYDIVLLKGDGEMGGETPDNQAQINAQCVRTAGRYVVAGTGVGTLGLVVLLGAGVALDRAQSRRDTADMPAPLP